MDDRYFDYHPCTPCEECEELGAYDIYGDFYCGDCIARFQSQAETVNAGNNQPDGYFE